MLFQVQAIRDPLVSEEQSVVPSLSKPVAYHKTLTYHDLAANTYQTDTVMKEGQKKMRKFAICRKQGKLRDTVPVQNLHVQTCVLYFATLQNITLWKTSVLCRNIGYCDVSNENEHGC